LQRKTRPELDKKATPARKIFPSAPRDCTLPKETHPAYHIYECQLFPKKQSADEKKQRREKNSKNNHRKKTKEETRRDTFGFLLSLHRGTAKTRKAKKPKPPLYRDTRQSPPKAGDQQQRVRSPFFLWGLEDLAAKDFRRWRGKLVTRSGERKAKICPSL
jgi:hypothetical protein